MLIKVNAFMVEYVAAYSTIPYSTINAFPFINISSTYYILSYDLINILNLKAT